MNEKVVAKVENCKVKVVEKTARSGKPYTAIVVEVNGKEVQVGFVSPYTEFALTRAGVKFI